MAKQLVNSGVQSDITTPKRWLPTVFYNDVHCLPTFKKVLFVKSVFKTYKGPPLTDLSVHRATEAHWVARLGALRRGAWPRGPWERVSRVRQVVLHPKYAPRGFRNDIALLRVDPVPLHARLRAACLPPARAQPPAGHHCTVVGWGQLYEHERVFRECRIYLIKYSLYHK